MSNGTRANKRGKMLETAIKSMLEDEYAKVDHNDFFNSKANLQPIFAEQCYVGQDIFGKRRRVDFILYHPQRWPDCLVIQCKWQASTGSVEQKYPFEVLSIEMNAFPTIIVLDGGGYSTGAENWLKSQAGGAAGKSKLLHVLDLGGIHRFHAQGKI